MDFDIYQNGLISYTDDLSFLKKYAAYEIDNKEVCFKYDNFNPIYKEIKASVPEAVYIDASSELELLVKLMVFTFNSLNKKSNKINVPSTINYFSILECIETQEERFNCLTYATFLNDLLLAFGFKSKLIYCLPLDLRGTECHCITSVYYKPQSSWIILDPAFCTYYTDSHKRILGIKELRDCIIKQERVLTPLVLSKKRHEILKYFTKNLIRFICYSESKYDMLNSKGFSRMYALNPKGYCISDKRFFIGEKEIELINTTDERKFWAIP